MKRAGFRRGREGFAEAQSYRDWVFLAETPAPAPGGVSPGPASHRVQSDKASAVTP